MVTAKCFKIYNFMTLAVPGLARMFACLFVCVLGGGGGKWINVYECEWVTLFVCLCVCVCVFCA